MPQIAIDYDKEKLRDFCRKWKITEFSLFGSVVREDFGPESDVDVLVAFAADAHWSLFDMSDMNDELKILFDRDVDLLTRRAVEGSLNPIRKTSILSSAVMLDVA
ncbi:MAG TPA: nucleotidyltransferase domain-containing protein [Thermoanaerobaculia bacterium]|nr:nucleotidyltransferase domain-containing protein [Thermoanaerobaculia bacterium]